MQGMARAPRGMEVLLLTHGLRRMTDRSSDRGLHVPGPAASRRDDSRPYTHPSIGRHRYA
jgi:hypothetical protein